LTGGPIKKKRRQWSLRKKKKKTNWSKGRKNWPSPSLGSLESDGGKKGRSRVTKEERKEGDARSPTFPKKGAAWKRGTASSAQKSGADRVEKTRNWSTTRTKPGRPSRGEPPWGIATCWQGTLAERIRQRGQGGTRADRKGEKLAKQEGSVE